MRKKKIIQKKNIHLFIINRGNSYWNGQFFNYINENKSWIHHFKSDRTNKEEFYKSLIDIFYKAESLIKEINKNKIFTFDYVVDFTTFDKVDVIFLFEFLGNYSDNTFHKYIFISTDSTYNASELSLERSNEYFLNKYFIEVYYFIICKGRWK